MAMENNTNIAELLKDAPKGTKLWSPLCGDCYYEGTDEDGQLVISDYAHDALGIPLSPNGKLYDNDDAECLLFPSRGNRDWSTFKAGKPHKHFEPFQRVLVACRKRYLMGDGLWAASIYSHYSNGKHVTIGHARWNDEDVIPYEGNEDKLGKEVGA